MNVTSRVLITGAVLALAACHNGGDAPASATVGSSATVNDKNGNKVTVASSAGTITNLTNSAAQPAGAPALNFPNGFFSYNITGLTNGQTVTVTMTLPAGTNPAQAIKCINNVCVDLQTKGKATIAGDVVTLTLKDGDADTDSDGIANGTIVDPVGPANYDKVGAVSEPLSTFQWGLKKAGSYFAKLTDINFANDGNDLNVEAVHNGTYTGNDGKEVKGAGINVLVLDDGVDIRNEDLIGRTDTAQTRNFDFAANDTTDSEFNNEGTPLLALKAKDDPTPINTKKDKDNKNKNRAAAHGTNVAGIILASQNGKGVMGIAPQATLGGASFLGTDKMDKTEAYGGGTWASKADVINASFGSNPATPPTFDPAGNNAALRGLVNLRSGKGTLFVKATGNEFGSIGSRKCEVVGQTTTRPIRGIISCETPANDLEALEQNVVMVGAMNALGQKSSYSNGGGVNWVMGLGGEFGGNGKYGEAKGADEQGNADAGADGPTMFSTDLRTCNRGYANTFNQQDDADKAAATDFLRGVSELITGKKDNANCDYSYMNGTSAATPTVTGVVALILSANPNLGWRDVREILAATTKQVDATYATRVNGNGGTGLGINPFLLTANRFGDVNADADCKDNTMLKGQLVDGQTCAVLDTGPVQGGGAILNSLGNAQLTHSLWYGFGLVDAKKAVEKAKAYPAADLLRTTLTDADMPDFAPITYVNDAQANAQTSIPALSYGRVTKLGEFTVNNGPIGQLQLRVTAPNICIGSVGFMIQRKGTLLRGVFSTPLNSYYNRDKDDAGVLQNQVEAVSNYTLGNYSFYGASGLTFEVFAVANQPGTTATNSDYCSLTTGGMTNVSTGGLKVEMRNLPRVLDRKVGGGQVTAALPNS